MIILYFLSQPVIYKWLYGGPKEHLEAISFYSLPVQWLVKLLLRHKHTVKSLEDTCYPCVNKTSLFTCVWVLGVIKHMAMALTLKLLPNIIRGCVPRFGLQGLCEERPGLPHAGHSWVCLVLSRPDSPTTATLVVVLRKHSEETAKHCKVYPFSLSLPWHMSCPSYFLRCPLEQQGGHLAGASPAQGCIPLIPVLFGLLIYSLYTDRNLQQTKAKQMY